MVNNSWKMFEVLKSHWAIVADYGLNHLLGGLKKKNFTYNIEPINNLDQLSIPVENLSVAVRSTL